MANTTFDKILLGSIGLLVAALVFVVGDTIREKVVGVGDRAPGFAVQTDAGLTLTPASFGGKVLVLNFWASWCPPCLDEIPSLNEFQNRLEAEGVVVLGVSVDEDEASYRSILDRMDVSFQTAWDPAAEVSSLYGTYRFPETYVINSRGRVVQKIIGATTWNDERMLSYIRSLL